MGVVVWGEVVFSRWVWFALTEACVGEGMPFSLDLLLKASAFPKIFSFLSAVRTSFWRATSYEREGICLLGILMGCQFNADGSSGDIKPSFFFSSLWVSMLFLSLGYSI